MRDVNRRRMPRHYHRTAPVGSNKPGGLAPKLSPRPQERLGVLLLHHRAQDLLRGGSGAGAARHVHPCGRQIGARLQRIDSGVHENPGALVGMDNVEQRQGADPIQCVDELLVRKAIETRRRGKTAVQRPGEAVKAPRLVKNVEQHALVIAHEDMRVGKASHQFDHAHGVRPAVGHVAQHIDGIVCRGRREFECVVESAYVPVCIRGNKDRHGASFPSSPL